MPEVAIVAAARTPIGRFRGSYSKFSPMYLGTLAVKEVLKRAGIDAKSGLIDEVLFGQVIQAGCGQNPARQVALGAEIDAGVACTTINKVCGSSLKAVMLAANSIRVGEYKVIVAGGMESMSTAPHLLANSRDGYTMGDIKVKDSMILDGLWDAYNDEHMGNTGETVAREFDLTREEIDTFAARSHQLSAAAWDAGHFDWETFDVQIPQRKGDPLTVSKDEGIRGDTTAEGLARLRPVFDKQGVVTAGNASQLSDGASALVIADADFAREQGWPILAIIKDYVTVGLEPARVMSAPIPAIESLLERNKLKVEDVDFFEHNEAFASASLGVQKGIGIPDEKFNVHGGAVALGHPLGASGARCLTTLIGIMKAKGGKKGIVALCLGGGNAVGMLVERV